jgi:hypothetical protein
MANLDAAAAAFVLGLAAFGIRQMLGLPDPDAGLVARTVMVAVEIGTAAAAYAVYSVRTGTVLRGRLPAFPALTWNVVHLFMGLVVGAAIGILQMDAEPAVRESPAPSLVAGMAIGGILAGAAIGAGWGVLQALILRKAAREVGFWISWSALSGTTFGAYALVLYIGSDQTLASESLTQFLSFAITLVAGIVMLPALHRLQPR